MSNLSLNAVVEKNPNVKRDLATMEEALALVKRLREKGTTDKQYELASPFTRHRGAEASPIVVHST